VKTVGSIELPGGEKVPMICSAVSAQQTDEQVELRHYILHMQQVVTLQNNWD